MPPKFIILKIHSKVFYQIFVRELTNYPKIFFFSKRINGVYTVIIKCQKYYEYILGHELKSNIYLSYIYLYTNIALILSDLIIRFFEEKITKQILQSKYRYLPPYELMRFSNIAHAVLDSNFPSADSRKLYLYRKELILNKLLIHFRNHNYLFIDSFVFFKLSDYHDHLEDIIEKTYSRY